jgi:hypothetical protein
MNNRRVGFVVAVAFLALILPLLGSPHAVVHAADATPKATAAKPKATKLKKNDPLVKAVEAASDCQWDCLSRLRSCMKQCKAEKGDCARCTTDYAACEDACAAKEPTQNGK